MLRGLVPVVALALSLIAQASLSAGQEPASTGKPIAPAIHIGGVDINKMIADLKKRSEPIIDQPLRVIDAGGYNLGVAVIRRTKPEAQSLVHDRITEVYHVLEGTGTLLTGGTLVDAQPIPAEGTEARRPWRNRDWNQRWTEPPGDGRRHCDHPHGNAAPVHGSGGNDGVRDFPGRHREDPGLAVGTAALPRQRLSANKARPNLNHSLSPCSH